ncbi:MAG: ATP-binding protein [Rhodobacter sp.]|nr:ATP-binding protein [Rhodobacter sp.]
MRLDTVDSQPFASPQEHMAAEFRWLDARLAEHVQSLRAEGRFDESALRGLRLDEDRVLAGLAAPRRQASTPHSDRLREIIDQRAAAGPAPPLYRMVGQFGLDAFERCALLCAAAPALDARYRAALALAQNDATRAFANADQLIALLDPSNRFGRLAAFAPDAPLLRYRLLVCPPGKEDAPLADRPLAVDDRVAMAMLGLRGGVPQELALAFELLDPEAEDWAPDLLDIPLGDAPVLVLETREDRGQQALAARRAMREDSGLVRLDLGRIPDPSGGSARGVVSLAAREARLCDALLYVDAGNTMPSEPVVQALLELLTSGTGFVLTAVADLAHRIAAADVARVGHLVLPPLQATGRLAWWRRASTDPDAPGIARRAWQSRLGPTGIGRSRGTSGKHGRVCRPLPALLRPVEARWHRGDLVVSDTLAHQLDELTAFVSNWPQVLGSWGFGDSNPQSRHCIALFSGPSGTGKTMAASIVAQAAEVPLYRASLAGIFDKYLGETEKQIDRLFDAAAEAGIALVFDEADALFGSRTEINDAHARYANLTVSHLLQRVEEHEGLVILTSNLPRNIDEAFARRIGHVLAFALPDAAGRRKLWARAIPAAAPLEPGVDLPAVAETFELSGGDIRNAALAAAYLAAAEGAAIGMRHLLRAVERTMAKAGRTPIAADFGRLDAER